MGKTQITKIEIVNTALELGVVKAALLHGVNRKSVSNWLQKFKAGGQTALANKSRQQQHQPKAIPADIVAAIIKIKQEQPLLSAAKIKNCLNLNYSKTAIQKKISQLSAAKIIEINLRNSAEFYAGFKKIDNYKNENNYLFYLWNCGNAMFYSAVAKERSALHAAVYLDYFIKSQVLHNKNIVKELKIITNDQLTAGAFKILKKLHADLPEFQETDSPPKLSSLFQSIKSYKENAGAGQSLNVEVALMVFQLKHNYQQICGLNNVNQVQKDKLFAACSQISVFLIDSQLSSFLHSDRQHLEPDNFMNDEQNSLDAAVLLMLSRVDLMIKKADLQQAKQYCQLLLKLPSVQVNNFLHQKIWHKLGVISQKLSDWPVAEFNYRQSLKICQNNNIDQPIAHLYGALGVICFLSGNLRQAQNYALQELEIAKTEKNLQEEVNALQSLGSIAEAKGSFSKALNYYQQIIGLVEQTGRLADKTKTLGNIGVVYYKLQKLTKAKEFYEEAIFLAEKEKNRRQLCRLYGNLGVLLENQGKIREALTNHQMMHKLAIEQNNRNWIGVALANIGNLQLATGNYVEALNSFQELLQISRKLGQKENESIALANLGLVHSALKRNAFAIKYLKSAVKIAIKFDLDYRLIFYYQDLAKIELEKLQFKQTLSYLKSSEEAAARCNNSVLKQENSFLFLKCELLSRSKDKCACNLIIDNLCKLADNCKEPELKSLIYSEICYRQKELNLIGNQETDSPFLQLALTGCTKLWKKTGKIIFLQKIDELKSL